MGFIRRHELKNWQVSDIKHWNLLNFVSKWISVTLFSLCFQRTIMKFYLFTLKKLQENNTMLILQLHIHTKFAIFKSEQTFFLMVRKIWHESTPPCTKQLFL